MTACIASVPFSAGVADGEGSPIFGVKIPEGYRQWELIAPSHEEGSFNELRGILGNAISVKAYRDGTLPFPDGAMLAKLAWKRVPSTSSAAPSFPATPRPSRSWSRIEKVRRDRRLGIWPLHRRQTRRRRAARDLLRLPPGQRERPRLRLHAFCAVTVTATINREKGPCHDDRNEDRSATAEPHQSHDGTWTILVVLLALLAATMVVAYLGWTLGSDADVPASGYVAMALGVIVSLAVGFGLMALIFYSSRAGYDEPPVLLLPPRRRQMTNTHPGSIDR